MAPAPSSVLYVNIYFIIILSLVPVHGWEEHEVNMKNMKFREMVNTADYQVISRCTDQVIR